MSDDDVLKLLSGSPTYLIRADLKEKWPPIVINEVVANYVALMLEAGEERGWTTETPHVVEYRDRFQKFLELSQAGDEMWDFSTFDRAPMLSGRAGYVIMRGGAVAAAYITMMS